ncbi:MAG: hypothetical protein JZU63_07685 [Rhodoferax sp.]|nr:hypothetical protein [Rhodoferax sp.]
MLGFSFSTVAVAADPPAKLQVVKVAWGPGASWDFAYAQHVDLWRHFGVKIDMVEGANGAALLSFLGSGEPVCKPEIWNDRRSQDLEG